MAIAAWKDLCIDAVDASVLGRFWGGLLDLEPERFDNGNVVLTGERPQRTIWVNQVPEARSVKQRVHLDVEVGSLEPALALGASILAPPGDSGGPWTLMADPEGGEFCAFVRAELPDDQAARWFELVVDTADATSSQALADWWAEVLGGRSSDDGRGFWWVEQIPGAPFETLDVIPVPEPKRVKNRIHWDVVCDDVDALVDRGASLLREPTTETPWHVLADPQGNEFCAFASDR